MGNKQRTSAPGPAAPDRAGAGGKPRSIPRESEPHRPPFVFRRSPAPDSKRRQPVRGTPPPGSIAARIAALRQLTGWRAVMVNLVIAIVVPLALLALAEGGLRLAGTGFPTAFCLKEKLSERYIENYRFLWQFYSRKTNLRPNPFAVAPAKSADEVRIVVLGESAAAGTPEPSYNFGRILERMLRAQFPGHSVNVINAAMRGVNSHILLPVARDCCARLEPDLLIVYMGNNETVGLHAPGPRSGRLTSWRPLLRTVQWVRATRLGQLLDPLLTGLSQENTPADQQDDRFFQNHRVAADDPRRNAVYENFRANLVDLCSVARRARAGVILATVPVNLKDFPPLGSLHRAPLGDADLLSWQRAFDAGVEDEAAGRHAQALKNYQAAAALDDHYAELHFRAARCQFALGRFEAARREFALACDWDALQFRADDRLNDITRQVAARLPDGGVQLVDAERVFAQTDAEEGGSPGDRFFNDHVHPNFDGDYLLARTLFPAVCTALDARSRQTGQPFRLPPGQSAASLPVLARSDCAAQLAFTRLDEGRVAAQMVQVTGFPPFTGQLDHARRQRAAEQALQARFGKVTNGDLEAATATYAAAIRQFPEDWWLPYNLARLRFLGGDSAGAITQFEAVSSACPIGLPSAPGSAPPSRAPAASTTPSASSAISKLFTRRFRKSKARSPLCKDKGSSSAAPPRGVDHGLRASVWKFCPFRGFCIFSRLNFFFRVYHLLSRGPNSTESQPLHVPLMRAGVGCGRT